MNTLPGTWVKPKPSKPVSRKRTPPWHWYHGQESRAYCGIPRPLETKQVEHHWNPLVQCCQKCLERIGREGL